MSQGKDQSTDIQKRLGNRLEALTGLRFLAAFHVLIFHAGLDQLPGVPVWIKNVAGHADLSVSLFFVLSGFILTYNYFDRERGCRVADQQFWAARLARVYPVYLLGLVIAIPQLLGDISLNDRTPLLSNIAAMVLVGCLVQSWLPQFAWFWNFPSWSLSDEAFFYWCFPWLLRRLRALTRSQLLVSMLIVWLAAQVPPVLARIMGPDGLGFVDRSAMPLWVKVVQMNPLLRLPDFVIGILLGRLYLLHGDDPPASQFRLRQLGGVLSLVGLGLPVAAAAFSPEYPFPLTHSRSLVAPFNALLIFGLALGGGLLAKVLASRSMVLLGNASYALYLLHVPLIFLTYTAARAWFGAESPNTWPMFVAYGFVAIGLSILAFLLVEEPMRHRLRRRLTGWLAAGDPTGQSLQHGS